MKLQLSPSIPMNNENPSFVPRGITPPYDPLSFGGGHIPKMNTAVGGWPPFSSRSNPSLNDPGWISQSSRQVTSYILSFSHSPSMLILKNESIMVNLPSSSRVLSRGSQFDDMGNP
jgi:hypothetical protein